MVTDYTDRSKKFKSYLGRVSRVIVLLLGCIKFFSYIRKNFYSPMRFVENISEQWLNRTFIGNLLGFRSSNNKYIGQPDWTYMPTNLDLRESWIAIEGHEREVFATTPELRTVITRLSQLLSNGKWEHYNENGDEIEKSPWVDRLENPNVFQSRNEFLSQWMIQRCLYGNTFMYQLRGSVFDEVPLALWNLSPSRMIIKRTGKIWTQTELNQIISGYEFRTDTGQNDFFKTEEIIQFSMVDPDDPLQSIVPLMAIRMPISNIRAARGYQNVILTKKGAIGVWSNEAKDIMGAVTLTEDETKKLSDQLIRSYGIGDHQSSIVVSNKPLKWNPATYPTKDLMLFEQIDADKKAIIDFYGANENMFSRSSSGQGSTFNNVENGNKQCYQDTIIPIADDLAGGLSKIWGLAQKGESVRLCFDHVPVMKTDENQKSEILKRKVEAVQILLQSGVSAEVASEITGLELGKVRVMTPTSSGQPT